MMGMMVALMTSQKKLITSLIKKENDKVLQKVNSMEKTVKEVDSPTVAFGQKLSTVVYQQSEMHRTLDEWGR